MTAPKPSLLTARIPASGEILPRMGLGTYRGFDVGSDPVRLNELSKVLETFSKAGGRLIDSSPMYGQAEAVVGRLASQTGLSDKLFMATKVWIQGREAGLEQMAESQRLLRPKGPGQLELMQIHNLVDWRTQLKTLRHMQAEGQIKYIGITHYTESAFDELEKVMQTEALDFLQIPYHLNLTTADKRLIPLAASKGIAVIANEPFDGGTLFRTVRGKPLPAWVRELGIKTWAQYFIKFILGNPDVAFVIPGTGKLSHLLDNLEAGYGPLPDRRQRSQMLTEQLRG